VVVTTFVIVDVLVNVNVNGDGDGRLTIRAGTV
jgi:hypothetical protein